MDRIMNHDIEINIPDNTVIPEPIIMNCIFNDDNTQEMQPRKHKIRIGKNSKVTVVFHYQSETQKQYSANIIQDIISDENSYLEHVIIQDHHLDVSHEEGVHIHQAKFSTVKSYALSRGSKLASFNINTYYAAPNSTCEMVGLYQVADRQHVKFNLNAEHEKPHCRTKQFYRGIIDDKARAVFNGRVVIHPQAHKSESEQTNNNLLLSSLAQINSKPELQVYHDDVKATHGATIGQLDPDALFYLQTRGLSKDQAELLLRHAFLMAVIDEIENPRIQQYFRDALNMQENANGH